MNTMARRMFELVEPIGVIPYSADEPNEAMFALGFTNYWDNYFAGRAAPLGLVPAEVVDALFYSCSAFNVIPCAGDDESAIAGVGELRALLTASAATVTTG